MEIKLYINPSGKVVNQIEYDLLPYGEKMIYSECQYKPIPTIYTKSK